MRLPARSLSLCLFTGLVLTTLPAHATLVSYTDPVAFAAALTSMTNIGFEGIASVNSFKDYSTSAGLVIGGVQFVGDQSSTAFSLQVVNPGSTTSYYDFGTGAGLKGPSYNISPYVPSVQINLPSNITAVGLDLMTGSPNALTYQVNVAGTLFTVATANRPTRTFFGVTSDSPISNLALTLTGTVQSNNSYGLIDNIQFGSADQAPATPEGCTLLLMGSGLAAIGVFRKRLSSLTAGI